MSAVEANVLKFKEILAKREITEQELIKCIGRYASRIHLSPRNVIISRDNLKEQICGVTAMTDKVFEKALMIIGLTHDEIKAVTATV